MLHVCSVILALLAVLSAGAAAQHITGSVLGVGGDTSGGNDGAATYASGEPADISCEVGSATATRDAARAFERVVITSDVPFGPTPTGAPAAPVQKLDSHQPEGDTEPRRPVIVWVHGGGFKPGTADFLHRELRRVR